MAFSISTHNLPRRFNFSSYANALLYHNNVKPKRDGTRPLATNRRGPFEIVYNEWNKNICLVYHSTSVVTITPENRLLLDLTWNSLSTRLFADALTPLGLRVSSFGGENVVMVRNEAGGYDEYLTDKAVFDLTEVKMLEGQTRVEVRSVNTKRTSEPRKLLASIKGFLEAAKAINPTYLRQLYDAPRMESSQVRDPTDPESFLPWVQTMSQRRWGADIPSLMTYLRDELYDDYAVYDWTTLPDGILPTKGQTYRMIEEN